MELRVPRDCDGDMFTDGVDFDQSEGCDLDTNGEIRVAREFIENVPSLGRVFWSFKVCEMLIAESWAGKSS